MLHIDSVFDAGRVRIGAGMKSAGRPVSAGAERARLGATAPMPPKPNVADAGRIRIGAGMRRG